MAIYPIYNPETGEKKVIEMSVHEITQWYKDNEPWIRNWEEGCASMAEVGFWQDRNLKANPSWSEVLKKVDRAAASKSQLKK